MKTDDGKFERPAAAGNLKSGLSKEYFKDGTFNGRPYGGGLMTRT